RRPINKFFSVPAVSRMGADLERYVEVLLDGLEGIGEFDLVEEVATSLPVQVICGMVGIPEADWPEIREAASRTSLSSEEHVIVDGDPLKTYQLGMQTLLRYAA